MKAYNHILSAVGSEIWAVQPEKLRAIVGFLQLKASGHEPDVDVLASVKAGAIEAAARSQRVSQSSNGAVAVIPVFGLIMQRGNLMGDLSGPRATSVEQLTQQFRAAVNDPGVSAIVLDIDSPGGCVSGVPELAAEILDARKTSGKKIVAVSDSLCASAAYWLASACSEIVVTPSSLTGSIGVYTAHEDLSKALEMEGVSLSLIFYGANKVNGNSLGPLTDDARAEMQERVDYYGDMFDGAVGKGRKMSKADVGAKLGQGKVFNAQKAISSGMADSIGTLDDVLARFGVSRPVGGGANARAEAKEAPVADGGPVSPGVQVTVGEAVSEQLVSDANVVAALLRQIASRSVTATGEASAQDGDGPVDAMAGQVDVADLALQAANQEWMLHHAHRERELEMLSL